MVSTQRRFPGTTNKTSPTYPLGRDLTLRRPAGASRRDHNCCGSSCESLPSPQFSPLGPQLTIVLTHKREIDIPAALHCMLRARKMEYEGSNKTRRPKQSEVEAKVEKQTGNQSKNSRLADMICHSSNAKPVA